ncbi:MAG: sensor histidine kinase [Afipia sp.]|nr:sensor histidine kinase [Afipia sp.]
MHRYAMPPTAQSAPALTPGQLRKRARRVWIGFAVLALALACATVVIAGLYGRARELKMLAEQGHTDANLKVALLRAVLESPRALPLLLSEDQRVHDALAIGDAASVGRLNEKLARLVAGTKAAVLYVIGTDGLTIASSNFRESDSFVGNDYSFREYFVDAIKEGTAEFFALGNVSKKPGLYISRIVGPLHKPLGVVVVKMEFDQLEADWHESNRPSYVVDEHGVVLITSIPSWRFLTDGKLTETMFATIRGSLQFDDAPLMPLPITPIQTIDPSTSLVRATLPDRPKAEYLRLTARVPSTPWRLDYLVPVEPAAAAAMREARLLALGVFIPLLALAAFLLWRRHSAQMRIATSEMARVELERRVAERTEDLSRARDRLEIEISDHRTTEAKLQIVQQELVQANRLAILGQVAAGVAHEINQPVATIRAYADNARTFLERGQPSSAADNLGKIASLTERIGSITDELKAFARKGRTAAESVELRDAIDGAVVLLRSRFAGHLEALTYDLPASGLKVSGTRIRLEQVLINLFQNALEALEGRPHPRVEISVASRGNEVAVKISDNGPGIPEAIRRSLFSPFNTSKENGLGLGLVISKEIVSDYGGRIDVDSSEHGTCFTIYLVRAP